MSSIDKRIVQMEFENQQFERNARTTIKTMDELKKNMDFKAASSSLKEFDNTSKHFNLGGISSAVSGIADRFSTLGIIGVTALQRITNKAIDAGERIARAMTIEPVSTGFDEYELKMGSVQTIMASTGESLQTVNKYLDELNTYSDKTIYSFSDMTQNIGKFTNAGVKLEDAVKAIQGISNEAAVSGANAQEASRAMYNFAQALSAGSVKLIDWKSIDLANMGTVEFKNELIKTALEVGTLTEQSGRFISTTKDMNGKISDSFTATNYFNESLSSQWMTTEVLIKTLGRYADENTEIGKKAYAAAQDVKTLSMLYDSLKEEVQSSWAQTWEMIIGDFEQAKEVLTVLKTVFSNFISASSKARNIKIQEWLDVGGRELMFASLLDILTAIQKIIIAVKEAWRDIFPKKSADSIFEIMINIESFAHSLIPGEERMEQFKRIAKGLFAVLDVGKTIVKTFVKAGFKLLGAVLGDSTDDIVELIAKVGDLLVRFRDWFKSSTLISNVLDAVIETVRTVVKAIRSFISYIMEIPAVNSFFENFGDNLSDIFQWIATKAKSAGEKIDKFFDYFRELPEINSMADLGNNLKTIGGDIADYFSNLFDSTNGVKEGVTSAFDTIIDKLGPVGDAFLKLWEIVKNVFNWIVDLLKGANFGNLIFAGVGLGVIGSLNAIAKAVEMIANVFEPIKKVLSGAGDALKAFSTKLKAEALKTVAEAILILVGALAVLCLLPEDRMWGAVAILGGLIGGMIGLEKAAGKLTAVDWTITGNILALALGVGILTTALNALELEGIGEKLAVLTFVIIELGAVGTAMSRLGAVKDAASSAAAQVIGMAAAVWIIAHAFQTLAGISEEDIGKGLAVVETVIISLTIFSALTNRAGKIKIGDFANIGGNAAVHGTSTTNIKANNSSGASGILAAAVAIHIIISAFQRIAAMKPEAIVAGIAVMEIIFINFVGLMAATRLAGEHAAKAGASMLMISLALLLMAPALKGLASISGGELAKALAAVIGIGAVMAGLIVATSKAGKHGGSAALTMIGFSAALLLIPIAFKMLATVNDGDIERGLSVIAAIGGICALLIQSMRGVRDIHKNLLMLTIMIGVIGGIFIALTVIDTGNATSVGLALAAVIGSLAILVKCSSDLEMSFKSLAMLILLVASVGSVFALILKYGSNLDSAIDVAAGLSLLIIALAAAMKLIGNTKGPSSKALLALGVMGVITGLIGLMIAGLCQFDNMDQAIDICLGLSTLIIALSAALGILGLVGGLAVPALEGAGAILAIVVVMGAVLAAIGALEEWLSGKGVDLYKLLEKGVKVFEMVGKAIGALIGGIVEGIGEGIAKSIERIGIALGIFAIGATPFLSLVDSVDANKLQSITSLTDAIQNIAMTDWQMMPSGEELQTSFATIGKALTSFANETKDIDSNAVENAANAAKMLSELEGSLTGQDGLVSKIMGTKDLGDFANRMEEFAIGFNKMAARLGFMDVDQEAVDTAIRVGQMLAALEGSIQAQGGFVQKLMGTKDLGDFANRMEQFAIGVNKAALQFAAMEIDEVAVAQAVMAGTMLAELEKSLDAHGGILQFFTGDQTLDQFGANIAEFASGLVTFSSKSRYIDASNMSQVMQIAQTLSDFEQGLKPVGGVVSWFTGDGALDTFGANLESFGFALKTYFETTGTLKVSDDAKELLQYIIDLSDEVEAFAATNFSISGTVLATMINFARGIEKIPEQEKPNLKKTGNDIIYWIVKGLEQGTSVYAYLAEQAARKLADTVDFGMRDELGVASPAVSAIKVGKYVSQGLAVGIEEETAPEKAAQAKAEAVGSTLGATAEKTTGELIDLYDAYREWMKANDWMLSSISFDELSKVGMEAVGLIKNDTSVTDALKDKVSDVNSTIGSSARKTTSELVEMNDKFIEWTKENQWMLNSIPMDEFIALGKEMTGLAAIENLELPSVDPDPLVESLEDSKGKYVEVGKYIITGLAEGIEAEDSAEEAAKKKADNIVKAFEEGFKRLEIKTNRYDLEQQIWELTEGKDATEAEKTQHQIDTKIKQLEVQAQTVQDTQAKYRALVAQLGKDSVEAQEAENEWLQTQVDLHTMAKEITELQNGTLEVTRDMIEDSTKSYLDFMKNAEVMLASGITMEEIQKAAREKSGMEYILNPPKASTEVSDIVDKALQDVEVDLTDSTNTVAKKIVTGIATGIKQQSEPLKKEVMDRGRATGAALGEGMANGYNDYQKQAQAIYERATSEAISVGVDETAMTHSPSRWTYQTGIYLAQGLAYGYADGIRQLIGGMKNSTRSVVDLFSSLGTAIDAYGLSNMDFTPTITPVVDLSNVNAAAKQIDSNLGSSNKLKIDAILNKQKSQRIANTMYYDDPASPYKPGSQNVTNNYNFTQNNTSPKALSRIEIYRHTNNQFALLKGATKK